MPPPDWTTAPDAAGDDASPQRTRVYRQVLDAIRSGRLMPGARLPAARRLAADWRVARGAVDAAFAQLQAEGLIERRVGHGSFVTHHLRASALEPAAMPPATPDATTQRALQRLALLGRPEQDASGPPLRLQPGVPDTASFPLAAWRREIGRALADGDRSELSYGEGAGQPALRAATARHLSLTRSIDCRPEQVIIVASPLHAVELAAQVLLEAGDRVCVDDPGLVAAARALDLARMRVLGVPVDDDGFDVEFARRHGGDAAAVLLQPLNQMPTGRRTAAARQHALLDWADRCGAWILEHDVLGEIVHGTAAPPPMAAIGRSGRVIYIGSFSALTFPSLRLAYLVLPEALIDVFAAVRGLMGDHCAVAMQSALAGFIDGGHLASHLRQLRRLYAERRDALRDALAHHLPQIESGPMAGGLHASLTLPATAVDIEVAQALRERRVGAWPLSTQSWQPRAANGLVVGYGADAPDAIDEAVRVIAQVLDR